MFSYTDVYASVLLPGNINSCGEIAAPGNYVLTQNISGESETCFIISSDNVVIDGGGFTLSGTGDLAIDGRSRTGVDLTEGSNGYSNLIINDLNITGYTTGINISGNNDTTGEGVKNGYGGDGGDLSIYYSNVGSVITTGGNSSTKTVGGIGGNIMFTNTDLDISNSTLTALAGYGTSGRNTDGGLDLNYTGTLNRDNITLSSLSFFNDNNTQYDVYVGGTWPIGPGNISTCGTLYGQGIYTLIENIISTSTCFTIATNNITINGGGFSLISNTSSNSNYAINALNFSSTTIDTLTFTDFPNVINSSSSIIIKGDNLNLSTKKINSPNIIIDAGILNVATTTFITDLLDINYSVSIVGTSTATSTALTNLKINNLDYGPRLVSNQLFGDVWREVASDESRAWQAVASSVDGMKIVAVDFQDYIYGSVDGGITWTQRTFDDTDAWEAVAMSADGQKVVALGQNTYIHISTDGGFTWTSRLSDDTKSWYSVAMSADGEKIVAGTGTGYLYVSSDGGDTWSVKMTDTTRSWYSIAMSTEGSKILAGAHGNYIYLSSDGGTTWATSTGSVSLGTKNWYSIASSADGQKIIAGVNNGYLYTSIDGGVNWTPRMNDTNRGWKFLSSSADGVNLTAIVTSGKVYTSNDSGVTWKSQGSNRAWYGLATSKDGNKMIASVDPGYIYTSSRFPATFSLDPILPYANSNILEWNPVISWGIAKYCYYSYDNFVSTSTANCALSGSDIAPPPTTGNVTLSVKGISVMNQVITKSVNFTNNSNTNIQVNLPALNTNYDALSWFPNVDYSTTDVSLVTCQYSYDNFVSTSTVNCANNGSDILPPTDGVNTLSIRTVDSNGNVNLTNITFTYLYSFVKNSLGGSRYWKDDSIASDYTGTKIFANMTNGYIWTSVDGGSSWVQRSTTSRSWGSTASSDDGVKLVASVGGSGTSGYIYTSADSGATWTQRDSSRNWNFLVSSSDGVNLAASTIPGYIYTSNDSGVTWVPRTNSGSRNWYGLASSADGSKLVAVPGASGYIYISTNYGSTWATSTSAGSRAWSSLASSADGVTLVAGVNGGYIYISKDGGNTWTPRMIDVDRNWGSVASSADGMTLVAGSIQSYIYVSKDGGINWFPYTTTGVGLWYNVEISDDGKKIFAVNSDSDSDKSLYILNFGINDPYLNSYITINRPIADSYLTNLIWSPSVIWGFRKTTCQYSYDNFVSTSTANCALNGSDISLPPSNGSITLSLRSTDDNNNASIGSVIFNYILNGWTLVNNIIDTNLQTVAVSMDGRKVFAGSYSLYKSIDGGFNWFETTTPSTSYIWNSITSSADGTKLVASQDSILGKIYFSNDSGLNWTWSTNAVSGYWYNLDSSADGSKVVSSRSTGYLYTSEDYGETWTPRMNDMNRSWRAVKMSADGSKVVAALHNSYIYLSSDGGITWATSTSSFSMGSKAWTDIAGSSDGTKLAAIAGTYIYLSTDSGVTWATSTAGSKSWQDVTMSADGSRIAATHYAGHIYTSEDGGATWSQSTSNPTREYLGISSSADGNKIVATGRPNIFVLSKNPAILNVDILIPQNLSTTTSWVSPIVSWSTATSCFYSYNNWTSTSNASCAQNGADILPPPTSGSVTLSIKGIDSGAVVNTATSTFTYAPHYWCGTADPNWTNVSNWYTDANCNVNKGSIPINTSGVFLVGNISPIISSSTTTLPLFIDSTGLTAGANTTGVIFANSAYNNTRIVGNATFNDNAYNIGTITGNVIFNTATSGTFTLTNAMKWGGEILGSIKGNDAVDITNLIFNDSSSNEATIGNNISAIFNDAGSNNGTINGNVTFNNNELFSMGTVNGTATLNGLSQTLNGINNVINFFKQVIFRDTLFLTSGSTLNISGLVTILGHDANSLLTIRSTNPGIVANLNINGTNNMNYLRMKDLSNNGENLDLSLKNIFDDGNNSGFTFKPNSSPSSRNGITASYTPPRLPVSHGGSPPPIDDPIIESDTEIGTYTDNNSTHGSIRKILHPIDTKQNGSFQNIEAIMLQEMFENFKNTKTLKFNPNSINVLDNICKFILDNSQDLISNNSNEIEKHSSENSNVKKKGFWEWLWEIIMWLFR